MQNSNRIEFYNQISILITINKTVNFQILRGQQNNTAKYKSVLLGLLNYFSQVSRKLKMTR